MYNLKEGIMKTITFLRHAEPDSLGNLSLNGIMQTKARAFSLPSSNFDLLITSDTRRTFLTGIQILEELGKEVPYLKLKAINIPETNQLKTYYSEAKKALFDVISSHSSEHPLVISHSGVINELGLIFSKNDPSLKNTFFSYVQGFMIDFESETPVVWLIK